MGFKYIQVLPSVKEVLNTLPFPDDLKRIKKQIDKEIADVFKGSDKRFIIIIGPCSAHDEDAVCDYINRLSKIRDKVKDKLILLPRIYTNKPRTKGTGYKGMLHQPNHQNEPDIVKGLMAIRRMHIRAFSESHMGAADEMLYPGNYSYLEDVLSYVAVGARSVENQQHRLTVSGLEIPAGMKNPTSGDIKVMFDSIYAAQSPHVFVYNGWEVSTDGNSLAHAILRGSVDHNGAHIANYHYEDLIKCAENYAKQDIVNPAIIVDTNHSNSGKIYTEQPRIAMEIMRSRQQSKILEKTVKGLMIESFIADGAQEATGNEYGRSITDPCLGWEKSEKLIYDIADII